MSAENSKTRLRLSVVIPVYNVSEYLRECVDSVVNQRNHSLSHEIIIVNDGSTDNSGEICDEYAKRLPGLIRVVHQKNAGLGGARNTGIGVATGEYVMFVDSDDYIVPDAFSKLSRAMDDTEADILIYNFKDLKNSTITESDMRVALPKNIPFSFSDFPELLNSPPSACNKLIRTSLFADNQVLFPSRVWYEDLRTILKLYPHAGSIIYMDEALYIYRQRDGSIMNNSDAERNREITWAMDDIIEHYKKAGLYDRYRDNLELLAVSQVLIRTSVRVARINPESIILDEIKSYTRRTFPDYRSNPGVINFSKKLKLVHLLIEAGQYRAVNLLFRAKELTRSLRLAKIKSR